MKLHLLLNFSVAFVLTVNLNCKSQKNTPAVHSPSEPATKTETQMTTEPQKDSIIKSESNKPRESKSLPTSEDANQESEKNSKQGNENYRFNVSFYSKGEGTDREARERFMKLIENQSPKIEFEEVTWGREGEVDYCLKLSELNKDQQKQFINKARELLKTSELVHINENAPCVHKRE